MNLARHSVDEVIFELAVADEAGSGEFEDRLVSLIRGEVLERVDLVFSEICDADTNCRIDRIEIDLGDVPLESLNEEFPRRLQECLADALRRKLGDLETASTSNEWKLGVKEARFRTVIQFLETGRPDWRFVDRRHESFASELRDAAIGEARELMRYLSRSPRQEILLGRLVANLDHEARHALMAIWRSLGGGANAYEAPVKGAADKQQQPTQTEWLRAFRVELGQDRNLESAVPERKRGEVQERETAREREAAPMNSRPLTATGTWPATGTFSPDCGWRFPSESSLTGLIRSAVFVALESKLGVSEIRAASKKPGPNPATAQT